MTLQDISKQITDEVNRLSDKKLTLEKEIGILEDKKLKLKPEVDDLLDRIRQLTAEADMAEEDTIRRAKQIAEFLKDTQKEIKNERNAWEVIKLSEENDIKNCYEVLGSKEKELEEFEKSLEDRHEILCKDEQSIISQRTEITEDWIEINCAMDENKKEYDKLMELTVKLQNKRHEIELERTKINEMVQSTTKDKESTQKLLDDLTARANQLNKYADDIKSKEKIMDNKVALIAKKETELKTREIRVADKESVQKANFSL